MANLNVTYDEMDQAAKRLTNGQLEIESQLSTLQKLVESLVQGGYVTDTSSVAFNTSYTDFNKGVTEIVKGLTGMSAYLTKAAATFKQADSDLASALKG
jgi:WXG100 family type VII secretion target